MIISSWNISLNKLLTKVYIKNIYLKLHFQGFIILPSGYILLGMLFSCLSYKVNAYLSDVFEAPRLRDQMKQYDLVLKNLNKQKSYNEESCKRDMKYHRAR